MEGREEALGGDGGVAVEAEPEADGGDEAARVAAAAEPPDQRAALVDPLPHLQVVEAAVVGLLHLEVQKPDGQFLT